MTELMRGLQERKGIACLFSSHDLTVVERVSHRVAVIHLGQIVETALHRSALAGSVWGRGWK